MVLPMPLPLGVVVARHSKLAAPLPCGYGCHCKGAVGVLLQTQDGFVIGLAAGALSGSVLGPLDPLRRGAPAAETTATTADNSASQRLRKPSCSFRSLRPNASKTKLSGWCKPPVLWMQMLSWRRCRQSLSDS